MIAGWFTDMIAGLYTYSLAILNIQYIHRYFLSTESEQLGWKGEGLPSDDLSVENALVILQVTQASQSSDVTTCHHQCI